MAVIPDIPTGSMTVSSGTVGLSAGTASVGSVKLLDSAGTNKATIDAQGAQLVTDGGTATVAVTASSAAAVKASAGRICRVLTTSTATAALPIYDNSSSASGTIVGYVPASTAVGTSINIQAPVVNGIYVAGGAGTPAVTVSYS